MGSAAFGFGINKAKHRKEDDIPNSESSGKSAVLSAISESVQETTGQADAAVVDAVNAIRINCLMKKLALIDRNQAGADSEMKALKDEVLKLLTSNRGGKRGIHGFLGETSQVHIANIKAFINGDEPLYILLDDNSMTDYVRGMQIIQQKACRAGGHLGLDAIRRHMDMYPEFVEEGGIYQIPKDMYERYIYLRDLPAEAAAKLRREDYRLRKYIADFTRQNPEAVIEPMELPYADIQADRIQKTINSVKENTKKEFEKQRHEAKAAYAPSIGEFLKICGISAGIEACVNGGIEVVRKLKEKKKLSEFSKQDMRDIGMKFMSGCGRGAFRGGMVYVGTNIGKLSAAFVSGLVTALLGIIHEGYLYLKKRISRTEFMRNSLFTALEAAVSAGGAMIGKLLFKKHPVIGALAGSICGSAGISYARRVVFA